MTPELTVERLRELYSYVPDTGLFFYKVRRSQMPAGFRAGSKNAGGYFQLRIDGRIYKAHRLAWFYMTGSWPEGDLDHINRDRSDNRFSNLRPVTKSQNQANSGLGLKNTSGFKGVSFDKRDRKFKVQMMINRKKTYIGYFDDPYAARLAYCEIARRISGKYFYEGCDGSEGRRAAAVLSATPKPAKLGEGKP